MKLITVVMSVYNIKSINVISQSIKSILNQTYKNFEFIICDDGSTDNTFNYLKKFEKLDKRIKIIKNFRNYGLGYSLNRCIALSKGIYIARMDADDCSLPNRLEIQYNFLKKHQSFGFVGSYSYLFTSLKKKLIIRKTHRFPTKKHFLFGNPFMHPTLMFRKKIYKYLKGYNAHKNLREIEDYELLMRAYYNNFKGTNLKTPLLKYRLKNKRRNYIYRINEAKIQFKFFSLLKLPLWSFFFITKTLLADFLPNHLKKFLKKRYEAIN